MCTPGIHSKPWTLMRINDSVRSSDVLKLSYPDFTPTLIHGDNPVNISSKFSVNCKQQIKNIDKTCFMIYFPHDTFSAIKSENKISTGGCQI